MRLLSRALIVLALLVLASVPTAQGVSYGSFGAKVLPTSTDFNPVYAALATTPTICSRDTGVAGTFTDDLYYLHIAGSGTTVSTFDVRLTSAGGFSAGTIVASSDTDVGQTFTGTATGLTSGCAAFAADVGYVEADGLPGYSPGDEVVWSTSDTALGNGDIRLSTSAPQDGTAVTAGTYVTASDADVTAFGDNDGLYPDCPGSPPTGAACTSTAAVTSKTSFLLRYFDANINAAFDTGDGLFLTLNPASTPSPESPNVNDVFLYAGAGGSFGAKVTRSSTEYLAEPQVTFATAPTLGTVGTASTCSPLIIHFGDSLGSSTPFVVQMDDVVLYSTSSSCASPQPASSVSAGTRVTTTTQHQGTAFTVAPVALAGLIYYVDINGNGLYESADPVYLHRPATLGGTGASPPATGIVAGDLRLTAVTAGATSFTAGTLVGGSDADIGAFASLSTNSGSATQSWFVRLLNVDDAEEVPLTAATLVKYHENSNPANTVWNPTTDPVYVDTDSSGTVTAGDVRLWNAAAGGLVDYSALGEGATTAVAGGDADVTKALTASSDLKVSGGDATFDTGRLESVYFSKDAFVNDEDYRIRPSASSTLTAGQQVVCPPTGSPHADCTNEGVHASDQLQFTWCVTANSCFGRLQPNDIQVSPSFGTRQTTAAGADFVPTLKALPTAGGRLLRHNLGESTSAVDDTFYISGGSTTAVSTSAVRITPLIAQSKAAGTFVVTGDTIDLSSGATSSDPATAASLVRFRDTDGLTGYTLNDHVYMDMADPPVTGATSGTLSSGDVRLTTLGSLSAGNFVLAGNSDLNAGTAWAAGGFTLMYFDDNQNNAFDNGDMLYAIPPSPASTTQPVVGAIYLTGPTTTTSTGGGGGGGGGATTTTTSATTTVSATSTSSVTATSTASDTTSTTGATDLAAANLNVQASLEVERKDGDNVLTWDSQAGVSGYQVWSSASPFALVATLTGQSANTYTHQDADKDLTYLVTAYTDTQLTAEQVNNGDVPGYSGVPEGQPVQGGGGKRGWIPGPSLALVVLALAGVALAVRRRQD